MLEHEFEALMSPQIVDATDFGFSNQKANQNFLKLLQKKNSKRVAEILEKPGYSATVWTTGDAINGYYWVEEDEKIVWIVKYKAMHQSWLPVKALTQVLLWRDKDSSFFLSFPSSYLFFEFLLKRHGAMCSDREQTPDGKAFWKSRLQEAFNLNCKIALLRFDRQEVTVVNNRLMLVNLFKLAWGSERPKQDYRWLIWD